MASLAELMAEKLNEYEGEEPEDGAVEAAPDDAPDAAAAAETPTEEPPKESVGIESIRVQLESLEEDTKPLRELADEAGGADELRQALALRQAIIQGDDAAVVKLLQGIHETSPVFYDRMLDKIKAAYFDGEDAPEPEPKRAESEDFDDDDPVAAENARLKREVEELRQQASEGTRREQQAATEQLVSEYIHDTLDVASATVEEILDKVGLPEGERAKVAEDIGQMLEAWFPKQKAYTDAMSAYVARDGQRRDVLIRQRDAALKEYLNNKVPVLAKAYLPAAAEQPKKPAPTTAPTPPPVQGATATQTAVQVPKPAPGQSLEQAMMERLRAAEAQGVRF